MLLVFFILVGLAFIFSMQSRESADPKRKKIFKILTYLMAMLALGSIVMTLGAISKWDR